MAVKFIHVGMMKTASTYMQNVWLRDSQFALANQGAANFRKVLSCYAHGQGSPNE